MLMHLHLHREIVATLEQFGSLSEVTNRILQLAADGEYDIHDKPACPPRKGCTYCAIEVTEPTYLAEYNSRGPLDRSISLRRLLYWFVDNEIYNELSWQPVNDTTRAAKLQQYLTIATRAVTNATQVCDNTLFDKLTHINILLKEALHCTK